MNKLHTCFSTLLTAAAWLLTLTPMLPVSAENSTAQGVFSGIAEPGSPSITRVYLDAIGTSINGKWTNELFYCEDTGEWFDCFGELITEKTEPIQTANFLGEKFTVDLDQMKVLAEDGTVNEELTGLLPTYLSYYELGTPILNGGDAGDMTREEYFEKAKHYREILPFIYTFDDKTDSFKCNVSVAGVHTYFCGMDYAYDAHDYRQVRGWCLAGGGEKVETDYLKPGDVNLSGCITVADAVFLARVAAEDTEVSVSALSAMLLDANADGTTDINDVTTVCRQLAGIKDQITSSS